MRDKSEWSKQAACKKQTATFFPPEDNPKHTSIYYKRAIEICKQCPVSGECLLYSVENQIVYGIWGGKTPNQRKVMINERIAALRAG